MPMVNHVEHIKSEISSIANKSKSKWWNNYLKNSIQFIGVGIPDIRKILINWHAGNNGNSEFIAIADKLISLEIAEFKLAGILIYQEFLLKQINQDKIVSHINKLFEKQLIYDWNTCDWLSVRVLSPIIDSDNKELFSTILNWHKKEYLWHARASLGPFAQCKNLPLYVDVLEKPLISLIRRPERFGKTAVGWILREIYKFNSDYVFSFLQNQKNFLSTEVINNALKYMDKTKRKQFANKLK